MADTATPASRCYRWRAIDSQGQRQQGMQLAPTPTAVQARLLQQGLRPLQVRAVRPGKRRTSTRALAGLTRQLATMLRAGVPVLQACAMCARHAPPPLAVVLQAVCNAVQAGQPLHQAFGAHPQVFSPLYCSLVAAGEQSGMLDTLLLRLADDLEQAAHLQARVRAALMYPLVVVLVALGVVAGLLLYVVPTFEHMFATLGAALPWPTQLLMQASQWLLQYGGRLLSASILTGLLLLHTWRRHATMQHTMDRLLLQLPLFGPLLTQSVSARWARLLSTLLAAGIPMADALLPVAKAAGNRHFAAATLRMRQQLLAGSSVAQAMQAQPAFPALMVQLAAIGEASGTLDHMLHKAAESFSAEATAMLQGLASLLEPVLMVVLGLLIGAVVLALYLPVFSLGQAL